MKKLYILILLCFTAFVTKAQFSTSMAGTTISTTGWAYPSAASTHDSVMQLTAATGGVASYAKCTTAVDMSAYCKFIADYDFKINPGSGGTADGITFFFLSNPPPTGITGSAIGIAPYPYGMILFLDTYDNDGDGNNPLATLEGYTGGSYQYNEGAGVGVIGSVVPRLRWVNDGNWHHVRVTYDAGNVNVYFDYSSTSSISGYYPLTFTGYFGFSSSTGGVTSTQSIKQVYITAYGCLTPANNGPLCPGDELDLYAYGDSTAATYYWYGPNGFSSTDQNPIIPNVQAADSGVYHVVKTVSGVPDTGFTIVNVKRPPVLNASSNSPVCAGLDINLTSGPDSTGETFSWTGPGTFTSGVENPTIAGASATDTGYYTVVATFNGCSDTATTHVRVTTVDTPLATNNTPECLGFAVNLYATETTTGVSYNWSGPSGFTSTNQNPYIGTSTSGTAGTYTVVASIGTCTVSATTVVVLSPTPPVPTIAVTPPICSGRNLTLVVVDTAGATYQWSGPNSFSSTMQDPTITGISTAATGMYTVIASFGGCSAPPAFVYVLVDSTPAIPSVSATTPICSGQTLSMTSSCATPGVNFSWSGPDTFSASIFDPTISPAQTLNSGNYTVTVTKGICSNSNSVNVVVNQTPSTPVLTSTSPVCSGDLLTLSATASPSTGTWHWSGPNGFTSLTEFPSILSVSTYATGTYTVYEVSNGCYSPVSTIDVIVNSTPDVPLEYSNSPVCQGDTLKLFASDDTAGVNFSWAGPLSFISLDQNPIIPGALPTQTGIYTVTATLGGCSATQQVTATVIPSPVLVATSNSPVCSGDTLKLNATSAAGNTFVWTGPFSFTGAGSGPTRYPAVPEDGGVYIVTVTDANGCHTTGTDSVAVVNSPEAPWVNWLTYCQYAYAPPLMAVDATSVLWYASGTGGSPTAIAPTPNTAVPGIYFFYLNQTKSGCSSPIDSIQVQVNPRPVTTLTPAVAAICPHDSVAYTAVDADPYATYRWYPSLYLNDSLSPNAVSHPVTSIKYELVTTNDYNCTDTDYASITVYPAALISINGGDSISMFPGESYHLQPATNCVTLAWFPPTGLDDPTITDPTLTPGTSTEYIVVGSTSNGCTATDSVFVHLNDETLYGVPNAFSPGGINNVFRIYKRGEATLNHFYIFNRWGEKVFETTNPEIGWDGTFNGTPQPVGVYVYDIQAVSAASGKVVNMVGNLTLMR